MFFSIITLFLITAFISGTLGFILVPIGFFIIWIAKVWSFTNNKTFEDKNFFILFYAIILILYLIMEGILKYYLESFNYWTNSLYLQTIIFNIFIFFVYKKSKENLIKDLNKIKPKIQNSPKKVKINHSFDNQILPNLNIQILVALKFIKAICFFILLTIFICYLINNVSPAYLNFLELSEMGTQLRSFRNFGWICTIFLTIIIIIKMSAEKISNFQFIVYNLKETFLNWVRKGKNFINNKNLIKVKKSYFIMSGSFLFPSLKIVNNESYKSENEASEVTPNTPTTSSTPGATPDQTIGFTSSIKKGKAKAEEVEVITQNPEVESHLHNMRQLYFLKEKARHKIEADKSEIVSELRKVFGNKKAKSFDLDSNQTVNKLANLRQLKKIKGTLNDYIKSKSHEEDTINCLDVINNEKTSALFKRMGLEEGKYSIITEEIKKIYFENISDLPTFGEILEKCVTNDEKKGGK